MDYIVGMPRQTTNFLLSLGFGFCIGVLYDVVRTIRLIFGGGKRTVLIFDILYSAFAGLVTFIFSLVITNGMVMAYVVFGEMLGFFIYYITFGVFAVRFSERVTKAVKGFFIKIFKAIAAPFLKLFGFLKRVFGKISQKSRKKAVKAAKKSKIHLKLCGSLLYNQLNNKRNYPKMRKEVKQNGCRKKSGKSKEEKGKAKHSFILTLLLVLAVGYFTISLIDTQLKIKEREKTAEQVSAQYEQQLAENERLQKVADGGSQEDYIERVAREKLGYVMPDEKVYYDITPGN